jgi:WD40 repeat protein/predicted ATPase/DNA-binding SARP family transcriptional activator
MRLELRLFGQFEASWGEQPIVLASGAARALLAYLALEPARPHRRELLAALFWPDQPQAAAYANLRQVLARIRKALPEAPDAAAFLEITPQTLRFRRDVATIDAVRFGELLAACAVHAHPSLAECSVCADRMAEAVSLYRAELLEGLFLAQPFDEWLVLKREQLHQQALDALGNLAQHHLGARRFARAGDAARRQIALSPWHEPAHRQLMRALAGGGERAAALVAFERCRQILRDELGVEPDAETLELAARLRADDAGVEATLPALPAPLTPLFGREGELTSIEALLRDGETRLVTIAGVGGAGKTRLALAVAWALRAVVPDGVGWAPLAGIAPGADAAQHADGLVAATGAAFGLTFDGRRAPIDELCRTLSQRATLLVLDNCEHLPVASFVQTLLAAAPQLRILATSRARLGVPGEMLVRLEGLPVPEAGADEPGSYAGMQLFLKRARRHVPDFGRIPADMAAAGRLCRLLDGLPLGIELAAHWVGHYTCDEIAAEIQADLDFLALHGRDTSERHHSLRPVFDYSWGMLREPERQTLSRLAVFRGTFDRAAALAVTGARPTALAELVDASLLRQVGIGRYGFHELVRQFAAARCEERGETEERGALHAAYYLELLARQEPLLYGAAPQHAAAAIRDDADNLRQAWSWAVAHGDWDSIARCLPALRQYTWIDGLFYESAARVAEAAEGLGAQIARAGSMPKSLALLGRLRGTEAAFLERQEARTAAAEAAQAAIDGAAAAGDAIGEAYGYLQLSTATIPYIALLAPGEIAPAIGWLERAITLCRATSALAPPERRFAAEVEAACLLKLCTIRIDLREYDEACVLGEQALALNRAGGDRFNEARALSISAMALENAGRFEAAYERRVAMLELARANGSRLQEQLALNNLSCTLIYLGDYPAALEHAQAALRISGEWMQNPYHAAEFHHTLSWAACRAGETRLALDTGRQALAFAQASGAARNQTLPLLALGDALHDLGRYDEAQAAYSAALALGRERQTPQPVAVALAGIASCRLMQGSLPAARQAVDELLDGADLLTLGSLWEPLRVAEICLRVLQATRDPRATSLLHAAAALLEQQAGRITDQGRRQIFREAVAAHRALLAAQAGEFPGRPAQAGIVQRERRDELPVPASLFGRRPELERLERWITSECRLVALLGMGGVGKTTLAAAAASVVAHHFDIVVWRSLLNAPPPDELVLDVLRRITRGALVEAPADTEGRIALLIDALRRVRCLIVLDNMESVLQPQQSGRPLPGYEGYIHLLRCVAEQTHRSCVLLTSRERPQGLARLEADELRVRLLALGGLDDTAGQAMLAARGLADTGDAGRALVRRYSGNPLVLRLVAQTVQDVFGGDIAAFLGAQAPIFDDVGGVLDEQLARLAPLERELMTWLAIEREPVAAQTLRENLVRPGPARAVVEALHSLVRRSLVTQTGHGLALQNVITEYLTDALVEQVSRELLEELPPHAPVAHEPEAFLNRFALLKAQAKDYVRASQERLILQAVAARALEALGHAGVAERLLRLVARLRAHGELAPGYAAGNLLNLLLHLRADLRGADFSRLNVWQAALQGALLPEVNFAGANLARSTFTNMFGDILAVQFAPDGQLGVAGVVRGRLRLWRIAGGQPREEHAFGAGASIAVFSLDGRLLASGHADHQIRVWDTGSGELLHTFAGHDETPWSLVVSPDGGTLVSGGFEGDLLVWDIATGWLRHTLREHTAAVPALAFAADGRTLASGDVGGTVCVWRLDPPELLRTIQGHAEEVHALVFDSAGAFLATSSHDRTIRLWRAGSGELLDTLQTHTDVIRTLAISSDGRRLASGGGDTFVCVWDTHARRLLHTLADIPQRTIGLVFDGNGETLAVVGSDHSIGLWSVAAGRRLNTFAAHSNIIWSLDVSPHGSHLVSGGGDGVPRIWNVGDGIAHHLRGHTSSILAVAWSPRGDMLASGGGDRAIHIWDAHSSRPLRVLHGHSNDVEALQFGGDGRLLSAGRDATVRLWDVGAGEQLRVLRGHTERVLCCALSPDGRIAASGGIDQTIRVWHLGGHDEAIQVLTKHTNAVRSVVFSPDGRVLLSSGFDQAVLAWDVHTGLLLCAFPCHDTITTSIAFHPGGELLATGAKDHALRLWDVSIARLLAGDADAVRLRAVLHGHTHAVESVRFSPDGRMLYSGSADETVKQWDVATGVCLRTLQAAGPYAGMNIAGATGISAAQRASLRSLGAVERE